MLRRRRTDPKIERLRALDAFAACDPRELRAVAAAADEVDVPEGHVLCHEAKVASECYVILDGEVDVVVGGVPVARLGRGQLVGELGVIDHRPRSATVVAVGDVWALAIPAPLFQGLLDVSRPLRSALLSQLVERVRRLDAALSVDAAV
jgi:CRP-like cAMP-binding protein